MMITLPPAEMGVENGRFAVSGLRTPYTTAGSIREVIKLAFTRGPEFPQLSIRRS